jgi:hypothetical protein
MPWFKIDDSAYSHPKFRRAGNAALGLWLRCGAYSAQHLLEGRVPKDIAKDFGTAPQAAKLVAVGLWHEHGHDCPRCPAVADGDYLIHDFFEGGRNSTRAQVEASRKAATERQAKARAAAAEAAKAPKSEPKVGANRTANGSRMASESNANRTPPGTRFQDSTAGQATMSQRDGLNGVTPSHAMPHQTAVLPNGSTACLPDAEPSPYDTLADLKRALGAAGLTGFAWNLQASAIERVRQARERVGVPAMVTFAVNSAQRYGIPVYASAWVDGWASLEAATALPDSAGPNVVPFTPNSRSGTDANLAGHAAIIAQLAQEQNR